MAEFVWFFGASGAGKATLVNKVGKRQFLIPKIRGELVICSESLEWGREQRHTMLEEHLGKYVASELVILIKGQTYDLIADRTPYKLHENNSAVKQHIVFVFTKPSQLPSRTEHRSDDYWPNVNHDFVLETTYQITEVGKLCEDLGIEPIIIDNSGQEPLIMNDTKLNDLIRSY